ncbi:MAG: TlpA disulfide reductase family protein [Gammaproteobacteria bacterium]|nr:TlpA disulfide reductase family protein [Gammaproteobacteria bacterium]
MKPILAVTAVVCLSISLGATDVESIKEFTIFGEYLTPSEKDFEIGSVSDVEEEMDWSTASVSVTYEIANSDDTIQVINLASGRFIDGKVNLKGEIERPTVVTITATIGEGQESIERTALIRPGGNDVMFAIVDRRASYRPVRLVLVGTSNLVQDTTRKFTIRGDFRSMEEDLSLGIVGVSGPGLNDSGEIVRINHGTVLLEDGMFTIESEIHEPSVLSVSAMAGQNAFNEYFGRVDIVVEPQSEILITPRGWSRELVATAEGGRHHRLVDSWAQSQEYQSLLDEYAKSYIDFRTAWEDSYKARRADAQATEEAKESTDSESDATTQNEDENITEKSENVENVVEEIEPVLAFSLGKPAASGCEHVVLADTNPEAVQAANADKNPQYHKLFLKLVKLRTDSLEDIAKNARDPMDILLLLELGAYGYNSDNIKESVPLYAKVATMLDEELVARRVTPAREDIVSFIEADEADKRLVPGQLAPQFSLPALDGTEVALGDIAEENELVLIDFWASWCGPCIAAFPHMKELYSTYSESGLEIVSISLDSSHDLWKEASEEHSLPWLDLGDIAEAGEGEVAGAYGVLSIPKSFLLDEHGCIVHKNLSSDELERVLKATYGNMSSLDESDS